MRSRLRRLHFVCSYRDFPSKCNEPLMSKTTIVKQCRKTFKYIGIYMKQEDEIVYSHQSENLKTLKPVQMLPEISTRRSDYLSNREME